MMKNFDRENNSGKNHKGQHPNRPLKFLTASSIIGDKVFNPAGERMGTIKDIMIDLTIGKIEYIVIELGGFLGIGEKYFALPYSLFNVDAENKSFILHRGLDTLSNAPGFDKDHWPETNGHLFDDLGTYWGGFMGANTGSTPY